MNTYIFKCKTGECAQMASSPFELLEHMKVHDSMKPHVCNWCLKRFSQRGNLKKHARQHANPDVNDRKRFKCQICPKGYTERYNLRSHMKKKHGKDLGGSMD
mmetsp:Transcript_15925/g.17666  ORF Transcript_15925/g.17666 Transcript_15925/m.17666 type:complete len:102 (+) Transcript_15925:419-724(+)